MNRMCLALGMGFVLASCTRMSDAVPGVEGQPDMSKLTREYTVQSADAVDPNQPADEEPASPYADPLMGDEAMLPGTVSTPKTVTEDIEDQHEASEPAHAN